MLITIVLFILILIICVLYYYKSVYTEKKIDNGMNGIPGYIDALDSDNTTINLLNKMLIVHHTSIFDQVNDVIKGFDNSIYDQTHNDFKDDSKLKPIWIKRKGKYTFISEKLTILKNSIEPFPNIYNVFVSVFQPGMAIMSSKSKSRFLQRYHYGLQVDENDVGLKIDGFDVKWVEKNGFLWDDTIEHSMWNHTLKPRIILFIDILI